MNMKARTLLFFCAFVLCLGLKAFCVPAYPYPIDFKQSDRTTVTVTLKGDEKVAWAKTSDGYTLMRAANGDFVYAIPDGKGGMQPSSVLTHNPVERTSEEMAFIASLDKNLFYSPEQISYLKQLWEISENFNKKTMHKSLNSNGEETYKMLVILMSYSDLAFTTSRDEVDALFNQIGYSANGHQGSVKDYFKASSFGKLNVEATVAGPYTASREMAYYGENYPNTNTDMRARDLVIEAIEAANPEVDFSQFTNGEGDYVSCVYVLYAGHSAAAGGGENTIWPHRSRLYSPYSIDGVYVSDYGVSSEKEGSPYYPRPMSIGTICHEFSHVLGQADYYDTDYEEQGSFADHGPWDLMAGGNYNNEGLCPPLWSAHEREVRGYIQIQELTDAGNVSLPPLHSGNTAYKMSFNQNEYFIMENRQRVGWDYYLPGHGMLIFHVNKNVAGWNSNCANCDPNNPGLDLMEANSNPNNRAGNPFPGTSNKTSFTDETTPNSKSRAGANLNRPINNISENTSTGNITFLYMDTDNARPRVATLGAEVFADSIRVNARIEGTQSSAIIERGVCFSDSVRIPTIANNTMISTSSSNQFAVELNNLLPNKEYYLRAYAKTADRVGYGEAITVHTTCFAETEIPFVESFETNNTHFDCWGQEFGIFVSNKWTLTDTAYESGAISSADDGSHWAFIRSDWRGGTQTTKLVSLPLNLSGISQPALKFDYALKAKTGINDYLKVYYKTSASAEWTLLQSFTSAQNTWTEETINLPSPSAEYYVAFEAVVRGGYGVCIDDIEIFETDMTAFPDVRTLSYDKVTDIAAEVNASLLSNGNNPVHTLGLCYATHSMPTLDDNVMETTVADNYTINLNNLEPSTTYYVRAFAKNNGHLQYGEELQITTRCERISTYPYTVSATCVDLNAWTFSENNTSYEFSATTTGARDTLVLPIFKLQNFENTFISFDRQQMLSASTSAVDTLKILYRRSVSEQWNTLRTFATAATSYTRDTIELTDLSDEYFIAFEGVSNMASLSIKNIVVNAVLQVPIVVTNEPALASHNSISVSGEVTYEGVSNVTRKGICWAVTSNPDLTNNVIESGSGLGVFSSTISNLSENTTYYIRAFAVNSFGTSYGQEYSISTPYTPIFNNTISQDQTVCEGVVANTLVGSTPTGGDGTFEYQWIMSTDGENWIESTLSSLSTGKDLEMRQLFTTTYFRRVVRSTFVTDTSNIVTIFIDATTRGGNVFLVSENPATNKEIRLQLRANVGDVLYWERRKPEFNWERIENSEDSIYFTDVLMEKGIYNYRVAVQNGVCDMKYSGSINVDVTEGVGLTAVENDKKAIKISPNPSTGNICLISEKELPVARLEIIAMNGSIVQTMDNIRIVKGENSIDLSQLGTSSYILRIFAEGFSWETVLIINKR